MKYFIHDTNAFQDEKITQLFIDFGYEGIGLFFTILEKIALQEKPVNTNVLKKQLYVGKRLEKCWNFMEEIDLISSNNGETFNKQLLNFSETYRIKKEKNTERISQWRKNQQHTENVIRYESVSNTPKVKESKVNNKEEKKEESTTAKNAVVSSELKLEIEVTKPKEEPYLLTKKKRKLTGKRLDTFEIFWNKFNYKKGKVEAADSWLDIPVLDKTICERIYKAAESEAKNRPQLEASGKTPKMAQGWITARRWEDEIYSPQLKPIKETTSW